MPSRKQSTTRRLSNLLVAAAAGAGPGGASTVVRTPQESNPNPNPFIGQQFLISDQSLEPYNFPPEQFSRILAHPTSLEATYPIPGYDIFAPNSVGQAPTPATVEGWTIQIKLATDLSFDGADPFLLDEDIPEPVEDNNSDAGEEEEELDYCEDELDDLENKVFDAVLISLLPPNNKLSPSVSDSSGPNSTTIRNGSGGAGDDWTVCAAVWVTGLLLGNNSSNSSTVESSSPQQGTNNNSSCAGLVSEDCIADMLVEFKNSVSAGNCQNQTTLPSSCRAAFVGQNDADGTLEAVSLAQTVTDGSTKILPLNGPIFAASTYPVEKSSINNSVSNITSDRLKAVGDWVFPIVMSWTPPGGGDTQSHLSCISLNKALQGVTAPPAAASNISAGPSQAVSSDAARPIMRSRVSIFWGIVWAILGVVWGTGLWELSW